MTAIPSVAGDLVSHSEPLAGARAADTINPLDGTDWDLRLSTYPSASFFHSSAWAKTLHQVYDFSPMYVARREASGQSSLLPVMEITSRLTGKRGVSLPFTDHCEPLCSGVSECASLVQELVARGRDRGWKYFECRGAASLVSGACPSARFFGHRLSLNRDHQTLFENLDSSVRTAIRKARKLEVQIEFSHSLEAVRAFYRLFCKTRKRHGLPPQPFRFFQSIHSNILSQDKGIVALARFQNAPVAAAVFFHWGTSSIYKFGASDERFQPLRSNNLLMWEAICWHARHSFDRLDFGRTSVTNEGLRRFKLGWGAEEYNIEYFRYDLRQERFVTAQDASSGWHNRIFQVLPIGLSRLIGGMLYKHAA